MGTYYATVWDEALNECIEKHGPYETEAAAKAQATRIHDERGVMTAWEGEGKGDCWPQTPSNKCRKYSLT